MMITARSTSSLRIRIVRHLTTWQLSRAPSFAAGLALLLLIGGLLMVPALGQSISREFPLKVAFLYNFANYIEWPAAAFKSPTSPFVVGVLGQDPFGSYIDELTKKTVRGRPIVYRHYDSTQDIGDCNLLFIGATVSDAEFLAAVEATRQRHVLIVTEATGLARRGSVVNFFVEQNRLRFEINPEAAQRRELRISSKLLSLARLVEPSR
jgi:hypothetical protein